MSKPVLLVALVAAAALVPAPTASADVGSGPTVTHEKGYVLTCGTTLGRSTVSVELYTNSTVEVPAAVVIESPTTTLRSAEDAPPPVVAKGLVLARVPMVDDTTSARAGTVVVAGTYRRTGPVVQVHDDFVDDGQRVQVEGTNQRLRTRLVLRYRGSTERLACTDAFTFDVTTTRTPV